MLLENINNGPQCNSISRDSHHLIGVEAEAAQPQELVHRSHKQNSELTSGDALESQRNGPKASPGPDGPNNPEKLLICNDEAVLEAKYKEKVAENEELRAAVYTLEYQLQDIHKDSAAKLSTCHSQIEQKQAVIERLSGDVRHLQDQSESLQERLAEDGRVKEALYELKKEEGALRKQARGMSDKLGYYESLAEKQSGTNSNLKMDKRALRLQLTEAERGISSRKGIIVRQQKEISSSKVMIEELQNQTREMRETIHDLRHQEELREEEEVLDYMEDLEEKNHLPTAGRTEPSDTEELSDGSCEDKQPPGPEDHNQGYGRSFMKGLLVGVVSWFFAVGMLGSWNILSAVTYSYCDNPVECLSDCLFQLFDPYKGHNKNLRPF